MAEMTKDMYGAIGKFGNRTFYQRGGKTVELADKVIQFPHLFLGVEVRQ
jgi:hypothetical protein